MNLTKEELVLVNKEREKVTHLKESHQKRLQKEIEQKIHENECRVKSIIVDESTQVYEAARFVEEMDHPDFTLFTQTRDAVRTNSSWNYDYKNKPILDKDGRQTKTTVSEIPYKSQKGYILYKNKPAKYSNIYIEVNMHYDSCEYRMKINGIDYKSSGKFYKRVSTVIDKVETFYKNKNIEEIHNKLKDEFIANLKKNPPFKVKEISEKTLYQGGYKGNSYNQFLHRYKGVVIELLNGIIMECKVIISRDEACLIRHKTHLPNTLGNSTMDMLESLNKIEFQVNKEEEK